MPLPVDRPGNLASRKKYDHKSFDIAEAQVFAQAQRISRGKSCIRDSRKTRNRVKSNTQVEVLIADTVWELIDIWRQEQ